ncbi:RNA polymerase II C-terminal domain phosphatase-like protein 4 isoform X1, partial [Tanacetum coccineum]
PFRANLFKLRLFIPKKANKLFEMYIYTMGEREYPVEMANLLVPGKIYIESKVITRSDCTLELNEGLDVVLGQEMVSLTLLLECGSRGYVHDAEVVDASERVHRRLSLAFIPGVLFIDEVHLLDIKFFSFLNHMHYVELLIVMTETTVELEQPSLTNKVFQGFVVRFFDFLNYYVLPTSLGVKFTNLQGDERVGTIKLMSYEDDMFPSVKYKIKTLDLENFTYSMAVMDGEKNE